MCVCVCVSVRLSLSLSPSLSQRTARAGIQCLAWRLCMARECACCAHPGQLADQSPPEPRQFAAALAQAHGGVFLRSCEQSAWCGPSAAARREENKETPRQKKKEQQRVSESGEKHKQGKVENEFCFAGHCAISRTNQWCTVSSNSKINRNLPQFVAGGNQNQFERGS